MFMLQSFTECTTPPVITPEPAPEPAEEVEYRSVCGHSCRQSSTSKKTNSELVGEFFDSIDIDADATSPLSDEDNADVTMVDSLANVESHTN